jgi:hypothetical protein
MRLDYVPLLACLRVVYRLPRGRVRFWVTGVLWSREPASEWTVVRTVREEVHRTAYILRHGRAGTVGQKLAQEGEVMRRSGGDGPTLDPDDLAYTREVIARFLDATDLRTAVEVLFGDAAGATLGFNRPRPQPVGRVGPGPGGRDSRVTRLATAAVGRL